MQLSFLDPTLHNLVSLTPADRKWMDDVINVVQSTWNSADPAQPVQMQYKGSDDYLRARFEEYVFGLLSTAKYCELHPSAGEASSLLVLCRGGKAIRLTYDHKGTDQFETKRITEKGGFLLNNRVNGKLSAILTGRCFGCDTFAW